MQPVPLDQSKWFQAQECAKAWRLRLAPAPSPAVVIWHRFYRPPYGGGNQFLIALRRALGGLGISTLANRPWPKAEAYLLNAIGFDRSALEESSLPRRIIHRVNGPFSGYRGTGDSFDLEQKDMNSRLASATVVQSHFVLEALRAQGFDPIEPVVIHNAADPRYYHSRGRVSFEPGRRLRILASSWSSNPRKGGPVFRWLEDHLDWERFEFTVVGNFSEPLRKARHIPPVPSHKLGDILRRHDIYLAASQNDPCSNALLEAMACGLPVIFARSGGHPELVGQGGLGYDGHEEILSLLDRLAEGYQTFQAALFPPSMQNVAGKYADMLLGR